ncbi:hypothetical protein l13_15760 [Neisseria weaveri ATCC 51223]|nr:hypothetical protein l13_15760 [Neisseria weaveri ATCC 51223]
MVLIRSDRLSSKMFSGFAACSAEDKVKAGRLKFQTAFVVIKGIAAGIG